MSDELREKGRKQWREFQQLSTNAAFFEPTTDIRRRADAAAFRMAQRLAPEMSIDPHFCTLDERKGKIVAHSGGVQEPRPLDAFLSRTAHCCSNTFADDPFVPALEKALTFYLYFKLFQRRFQERPDFHEPPYVRPVPLRVPLNCQFLDQFLVRPGTMLELEQAELRLLQLHRFRQPLTEPFR